MCTKKINVRLNIYFFLFDNIKDNIPFFLLQKVDLNLFPKVECVISVICFSVMLTS